MRRMSSVMIAIVSLAPLAGAAPQPDAGEQSTLIARMRSTALSYADGLQDFLCRQTMTRTVDRSGTGKSWKLLETQVLDLGYVGHKEHYRLVEVNGKTSDVEARVKRGYWKPGGEFGSSLRAIFEPRAAAEFSWDHEESVAGNRNCVFRYRVAAATSTYQIQADLDHVRMAHHGLVTADCQTGAVTRIQIETEPASVRRRGHDVAIGMQLDVQYGPVRIGAGEFLLPLQAVEIAPFGKTLTKAEIRFDQYRKYDSNSKITFDDGAGKLM